MEGLVENRSSVSYDAIVPWEFCLSHPIHWEEGVLRCWDASPAFCFSTGRGWCCHRAGAGQRLHLKRRALLQYCEDFESSESPHQALSSRSSNNFHDCKSNQRRTGFSGQNIRWALNFTGTLKKHVTHYRLISKGFHVSFPLKKSDRKHFNIN